MEYEKYPMWLFQVITMKMKKTPPELAGGSAAISRLNVYVRPQEPRRGANNDEDENQ